MKKFGLFIFLFFLFLLPTKAELTDKQAGDIAFFAENFINEGNKRINNGFPIFAYMQGQARIDGFQGELYKVNKDYKSINTVNDYKWTFDCSSFASYVYYHTFNLVLTKSNTSKTDPYSGLKLMRETANPYEVSDFVANADNNRHFYYVAKEIPVPQIDYITLKKGDLIVIVGSHIMVYVGDGKIAHASSTAITSTNLGMEVIKLADKYQDRKVSIIRLKDHIIPTDSTANLVVTWPDNNSKSDLNNLRVVNDIPQISYTLSTDKWANKITLTVNINDADGIANYTFNDNNLVSLNTKTHEFTADITENKTYIVKVSDSLKNSATREISITNIDNIKPKIILLDVATKDNYSLVTIKGEDLESGLATDAYSFKDDKSWSTKNVFEVFNEGTYKIYIKDQANNIFETEVTVKFDDKISPTVNNVIYGENTDKGQKITITATDTGGSGIVGFLIKDNQIKPSDSDIWVITTSENYTTFLTEGNHYLWVKDANGNISSIKEIVVEASETIKNYNIFLFIIPIIIIVVGAIFIKKYRNNKI